MTPTVVAKHPGKSMSNVEIRSIGEILLINTVSGRETVDARTLHMALEVGRVFGAWIQDRIEKYGFQDGRDYEVHEGLSVPDSERSKARPQITKDYALSVAMAKELAMVENNDRGREVRQFLIQVEEAWNSPDMVILRGLQMAEKKIVKFQIQIAKLQPKADFYDAVTGSCDAVDLGVVAKTLAIPGYGRNTLFQLLREEGILMEDNVPYQRYVDSKCFRVIENSYTKPDRTVHVNFKTVVHQKGIDLIRRVIAKRTAT